MAIPTPPAKSTKIVPNKIRIFLGVNFSASLIRLLKTIAKIAELMAPTKISAGSSRLIPNKIKLPNPPAPINAAKVASPHDQNHGRSNSRNNYWHGNW